MVDTNTTLGKLTVIEICELLGPGPGSADRPRYNDIQCGNGPPNDAGDEELCPGRVDIDGGCGQIGPKWNFDAVLATTPTADPASDIDGTQDTEAPTPVPTPATTLHPDIVEVIEVEIPDGVQPREWFNHLAFAVSLHVVSHPPPLPLSHLEQETIGLTATLLMTSVTATVPLITTLVGSWLIHLWGK